MNTLSNQRMLKSRMSTGWAHNSDNYRFPRTSEGAPFEEESKGISWGEAAGWFVGTLAIFGLIFYALHFL
jgi:hypothetical protein